MKKKIIRYTVTLAVLALFIGTFVSLYKKSRPEVITYNEITVSTGDISKSTVITGKITPRNEVNIKPQINGIIAELLKEAGQTVQQGEVIAKLTVIPDMGSLSNAQSRLRLTSTERRPSLTNPWSAPRNSTNSLRPSLKPRKRERQPRSPSRSSAMEYPSPMLLPALPSSAQP